VLFEGVDDQKLTRLKGVIEHDELYQQVERRSDSDARRSRNDPRLVGDLNSVSCEVVL